MYDLLFKYRGALSLRNDIGICPNIEVDLQVIDKSPCFILPFHVAKEGTPMIDTEMLRWLYLCTLKQDSSPYTSPIMMTARKNSHLKWIITDLGF